MQPPTEWSGGREAAGDHLDLDSLLPLDPHLAPGREGLMLPRGSLSAACPREDWSQDPIHHLTGSASQIARAPCALRARLVMRDPGVGPGCFAGFEAGRWNLHLLK